MPVGSTQTGHGPTIPLGRLRCNNAIFDETVETPAAEWARPQWCGAALGAIVDGAGDRAFDPTAVFQLPRRRRSRVILPLRRQKGRDDLPSPMHSARRSRSITIWRARSERSTEPSSARCATGNTGKIDDMRNIPAKPRLRVAVVVYDGVSVFEFAVACEVFGADRSSLGVPRYRFDICADRPEPVHVGAGFTMEAPSGLETLRRADTIIVLPTKDLSGVSPEMLEALKRAHRRGARLVSLCTGAFVLAAAGLLDDRPATTHWRSASKLADQHPRVSVDPNVLYVDDGDILTSAGSVASIDLCLHVVRSDYGAEIAARVARDLVVPLHRPGGQAQFIDAPIAAVDEPDLFSASLAWAEAHLDEVVTIEDLAARAAMSPRTFARRFQASTGTTPYRWLLRQRISLAQRYLETTELSVELVASRSGFGTATNLRKHFRETVRVSPNAYRRSFRAA
jgi:AraC family transcriptional regulator, transcriptional activator FtrA